MEPWALAVLCTMLLLAGAAIGGLTVFIAGVYMRRGRTQKEAGLSRTIAAEEHEAQSVCSEKHVPQDAAQPQPPTLPAHSPAPALRVSLGERSPPDSAPTPAASSTYSGGTFAFSSAATAVARPPKQPATVIFRSSMSSMAPPPLSLPPLAGSSSGNNNSNNGNNANPHKPARGGGGDDRDEDTDSSQPSAKSSPASIDESNPDTISSVGTPEIPCMAASPGDTDSVDYVVVPPSPSILSMYGASLAASLSRPPSILSPRVPGSGRPLASPGYPSASLFSPMAATYSRKYFDTPVPPPPLPASAPPRARRRSWAKDAGG
ncbi:hypothetical protein H4R18_001959 [Coemansia javaensis]|uniref:Uncharacterized protein n=1 Tax=Coemansia javaensis TaxID=2761396 RepID=A0A9W8HFT3_9FUNG|nr:hypothetical protein H4R18_001959 [Coemansia javaensis]